MCMQFRMLKMGNFFFFFGRREAVKINATTFAIIDFKFDVNLQFIFVDSVVEQVWEVRANYYNNIKMMQYYKYCLTL